MNIDDSNNAHSHIYTLVLSAGQSLRMKQPKLLMDWGGRPVIQQVVHTLVDCGLAPVHVVTGGFSKEIEHSLAGYPVNILFNPDYTRADMLSSIQIGLKNAEVRVSAALIVLGDQPQMLPETINQVVEGYLHTRAPLVFPSYRMRRGHPWIIDRKLWDEILALPPGGTAREVVERHSSKIHYVNVDTPTILQDLDTPEDYERYRPR